MSLYLLCCAHIEPNTLQNNVEKEQMNKYTQAYIFNS